MFHICKRASLILFLAWRLPMKPHISYPTAFVVAVAAFSVLTGQASAQSATELAGRWTLVSNDIDQDGKKLENFGANPKGELMFDNSGNFILLNGRADLPKIAAGNRVSGTADENKAIVQGSIALYGTYSVDSVKKELVFNIEYSTYPNWAGQVQRRPFTFAGDKLTYTVPPAATGRGASVLVWQRAK
jgi:hypothetical protein